MGKKLFQTMLTKWSSPVVARSQVKEFTGGACTAKTLANADSEGWGPAKRYMLGNKVVYPTQDLVDWLEERCKNI